MVQKAEKLGNAPAPKGSQTVVILNNAQSLVKLTPYNTEHTDQFQTNPSSFRLAAVLKERKRCRETNEGR